MVNKIYIGLVIVTFAVASELFYRLYQRNRQEKRLKSKPPPKKQINEVITFSYDDRITKRSTITRCFISPSFERLLFYLDSAKTSLDICMYVFTNLDISNVIVSLKKRGIKVRVIIDADMAYSSGSQARRLEKYKIPVRWFKSTNLMHHKFCVVDALSEEHTPYVMAGSLNWTSQALSGNWEDVIVTSQSEIVTRYKSEFERLWDNFKAISMQVEKY